MLCEALKINGFTNREIEVAALVSKGLGSKKVADLLFISEKTVKFHLTNIYKKMHVKSRSQFILWCAPHLSFEDKKPIIEDSLDKNVDSFSMPIGINKVGNA